MISISTLSAQLGVKPEEMVGPALFLASEDSSYVTGQMYFVDGGWTVQGKIPEENLDRAAKRNR